MEITFFIYSTAIQFSAQQAEWGETFKEIDHGGGGEVWRRVRRRERGIEEGRGEIEREGDKE